MEAEEDAIESGVVRPAKRLLVLMVVTYFAAVFYPLAETAVDLLSGWDGRRSSVRLVDWGVFPAFQFFVMDVVAVYGPVTIFCIVASAMDRCEAWRVNVFAAAVTFSAYVIEDQSGSSTSGVLMNLLLLVVVIGTVFWLWRDALDPRRWWGR